MLTLTNILTFLSEFIPILLSTVALALSLFTFDRQRKSRVFSGTKDFNSGWQVFNQVFVSNHNFLKLEMELHPFGELTTEEMTKVYYYFMRFNVVYSAYLGVGELDMELAESAFNNEANLSFHDRDFIKKHVFGRGYDRTFTDQFIEKWGDIKKRGKTLPMRGDYKEEYVAPLREKYNKN